MTKDCLHCVLMEAIIKFAATHRNEDGEPAIPTDYLAETLTRVALDLSNMAGERDQQAAFTTFLIAMVNEASNFGMQVLLPKRGEMKPDKSKIN